MNGIDWVHPLVDVTMDRRGPRTLLGTAGGTTGRTCYKLSGIDGSVEGGLRPFPGFRQVYEFNVNAMDRAVRAQLWPGDDVDSTSADNSGDDYFHNERSHVADFESFSFRHSTGSRNTDNTRDAWGIVYRVHRATDPSVCDVFFDYYVPSISGLSEPADVGLNQAVLLFEGVGPPVDDTRKIGKELQVSVFGSTIYVTLSGQQPKVLNPEAYSTPRDGGPGEQPLLRGTEEADVEAYVLGTEDTAKAAALNSGSGWVIMTQSPPSTLSTDTSIGGVDQGTEDEFDGNDILKYRGAQKLSPGDYAFAYFLYNSTTGVRSSLSTIAKARFADFVPPIELPDQSTTTGDEIAASAQELYAVLEIVLETTDGYDQVYVYRSVEADSAGGTFAAGILFLENIIDIADYAATPSPTGLGGRTYQRILYYYSLDDRELVYQPVFTDTVLFDAQMPRAGASIYFDGSLVCSSISNAKRSSTVYARPSDNASVVGAAQIRWSSPSETSVELFNAADFYIPRVAFDPPRRFHRVGPNVIGVGQNRLYFITKNGTFLSIEEIHEGFGAVASTASDVVGSLLYFVNTKGVYTVDAYGQLEQVTSLNRVMFEEWRNDATRIGNQVNSLYSYGNPVSVGFDSDQSALYILNERRQECYAMWFTTGKVSLLEDVPFTMVRRGYIPVEIDPDSFFTRPDEEYSAGDPSLWSSSVGRTPWTQSDELDATPKEKAIFLFNGMKSAASSDATVGRMPGLFVVNDKRDLTYGSGFKVTEYLGTSQNTRCTMLNAPGEALVRTVSQYIASSGDLIRVNEQLSPLQAGQYGRVVYSSTASYIGKRFRVVNAGSGPVYDYDGQLVSLPTEDFDDGSSSTGDGDGYLQIASDDKSNLSLLPPDSLLAIGSIPFEVQTWPVGVTDDQGNAFSSLLDYFRVRHINGVQVLFTEVSGWPNLVDVPNQRVPWYVDGHFGSSARLFRGDVETAYATGTFKGRDGAEISPIRNYNTSITASFGQTVSGFGAQGAQAGPITPGFLAYLVDTDFRMLGLKTSGTLPKSSSTQLLVDS